MRRFLAALALLLGSTPLAAQIEETFVAPDIKLIITPLRLQSPLEIDDTVNIACLWQTGDQLFHDTNCDQTKDAGEEFVDFQPTAGIDTDHGAGAIDATTDFAGGLCGTSEIMEDQGATWACIPTPSGASNSISQLNTNLTVIDTGTDGVISGDVDGVAALEINTDGTLVIGDGATAAAVGIQDANTAIGFGATAGCGVNGGCLAIGDGATTATGNQAIAIGQGAAASNNQAIAIGDNAQAQTQDSIAIGDAANANANEAIQIGSGNNLGVNAVSVGTGSSITAGAVSAVSVGDSAGAHLTNCRHWFRCVGRLVRVHCPR
jgi:hypothetical protein